MKKLVAMILFSVLLFSGCRTVEIPNSRSNSNESVSMIAGVDGSLKLSKGTKHFRVYCQKQDMACLNDLGKGLEAAYTKITKEMNCPLSYKVDVMVYPDIESFHTAINYKDSSLTAAYITGGTIGKTIYLTSPLNPGPVRSYEHLVTSSPLHEFTHVVVNELAKSDTWPVNVPRWLNEGIACYEGGIPGPDDLFKRELTGRVRTGQIPSLNELSSYGQDFISVGGYYFTLPVGQFIVEKYGFEKIRKFILKPDDYENAFGKTEQALWDEWVKYLNDYVKST